jgi:hypothetical protein
LNAERYWTPKINERRIHLKGTVARDFLASVFFMDLLYMGLRLRG